MDYLVRTIANGGTQGSDRARQERNDPVREMTGVGIQGLEIANKTEALSRLLRVEGRIFKMMSKAEPILPILPMSRLKILSKYWDFASYFEAFGLVCELRTVMNGAS